MADAPQEKIFWQAHVLVVDDEIFVRRLVRRMLGQMSVAEIVDAADGQEALNLLRKYKADIVICDYQMEPVNGLEFLKIVRSGSDPDIRRDLPVIMLTGDSDTKVFATAMALDVDAFVKKPIGPEAFAAKIQRCFDVPQMIKNADYYDAVELLTEPEAEAGQVFDPETMVEKTVDKLIVGDIIAMDVVSSTGTLLLATGMSVSAASIGRLSDLVDIGEFKIVVVRKIEPSDDGESGASD